MRIYNQMIENENKRTKSNKTKGSTSKRGRNPSLNPKDDEEVSVDNKKSTNGSRSSDKELYDLREENRRLRQLVDKYKTESKNIINKASHLKQKEKTSVMQTIELLKLNAYLISHLPDSERILSDYLLIGPHKNACDSGQSTSNGSSSFRNCRTSVSKTFKSPVNNPISNYFKSVDKSDNGVNSRRSVSLDGDSDNRPISKRLYTKLRESQKVVDSDGQQTKSKGESNQKRVSPRKSRVDTTERRVNPRKIQNRSVSTASADDSSNEHNEASTSKSKVNSRKRTPSESKTTEEKERKGANPKRKRRTCEQEPKGIFPCTFNPKLCDEIMDTKEDFDFHMSGHYEAQYICTFCAYSGPTIQLIKRHINKEREAGLEETKAGKKLTEDRRIHYENKIYRCLGCKVCDKIHNRLEKKCQHIVEDPDNGCDFEHDNDYEFKDHLRELHFSNKFKMIKDKDERRKKIRAIVDKFVDELYFENNAKKGNLIEKFNDSKRSDRKDSPDVSETDINKKKIQYQSSSDSDWD